MCKAGVDFLQIISPPLAAAPFLLSPLPLILRAAQDGEQLDTFLEKAWI